jgi:hypothetical protein
MLNINRIRKATAALRFRYPGTIQNKVQEETAELNIELSRIPISHKATIQEAIDTIVTCVSLIDSLNHPDIDWIVEEKMRQIEDYGA